MTSLLSLIRTIAQATDSVGAYQGGADLTLVDDDTITGLFTNVGALHVVAGATVFAQDLRVEALTVVIDGDLVADGLGSPGGQESDGTGPGAGAMSAGGGGGGGGGGAHGGAHGGDGGGGGWPSTGGLVGVGGLHLGDDALA